MMKKFLSVVLAMVLVVSITACGGKTTIEEHGEINVEPYSENTAAVDGDTEELDSKVDLTSTYKVPIQNIYVDTPNYQEIEQGFTELFIIHDSKYVAITAARNSTASNAKDAHEKAIKDFIPCMQNYEGSVNSIDIVKDETVNINGIEMYGFEGTINYGRDNIHDGYAIGYSFIMDGIPCEIIGSVIDEEQPQELIDEIKATVEAMIQTVRSEM